MSSKQIIETHIQRSAEVKLSLLKHTSTIEQIISCFHDVVTTGGTIYSCGNGGSACDAMHFTEELVARYEMERPGIRAHHLCDPGTITCWANDYDFETIFKRQVETHLTDKDVLVCFSTSGNSENVLSALAAAHQRGAKTVALLGKNGGKAKNIAKLSLVVDSDTTAYIQEAHIMLVHIFCDTLERQLYSKA